MPLQTKITQKTYVQRAGFEFSLSASRVKYIIYIYQKNKFEACDRINSLLNANATSRLSSFNHELRKVSLESQLTEKNLVKQSD